VPSGDQATNVAFDRENSDIGGRALQNLIRNGFRTGERGLKRDFFPMFGFPFGGKRRVDFLFERLFHDRKAVNGNRPFSAASGALGR